MTRRFHSLLTLGGLGVALLAVGAISPARADRFNDLRRAVHHDLDNIHRDELRLESLSRKRSEQRYRGDWRGVHGTEDQIDRARIDLQHDRDLLREDQRELDRFYRR